MVRAAGAHGNSRTRWIRSGKLRTMTSDRKSQEPVVVPLNERTFAFLRHRTRLIATSLTVTTSHGFGYVYVARVCILIALYFGPRSRFLCARAVRCTDFQLLARTCVHNCTSRLPGFRRGLWPHLADNGSDGADSMHSIYNFQVFKIIMKYFMFDHSFVPKLE